MDQAIHKLNVGHYMLDVKVIQLLDRLTRLEGKMADVEESVEQVSAYCKDNRKEIGRLEGAWILHLHLYLPQPLEMDHVEVWRQAKLAKLDLYMLCPQMCSFSLWRTLLIFHNNCSTHIWS